MYVAGRFIAVQKKSPKNHKLHPSKSFCNIPLEGTSAGLSCEVSCYHILSDELFAFIHESPTAESFQ